MSENKFVYYWSFDIKIGKIFFHHDESFHIYSEKEVEEFKQSDSMYIYKFSANLSTELVPSEIYFEQMCSVEELLENKLANKLYNGLDIIKCFIKKPET